MIFYVLFLYNFFGIIMAAHKPVLINWDSGLPLFETA